MLFCFPKGSLAREINDRVAVSERKRQLETKILQDMKHFPVGYTVKTVLLLNM